MDPTKYVPSDEFNSSVLTTLSGAPLWTNNHQSMTVGPRGPILLEDTPLLEKLRLFDAERIPERVVHARGASAHGYFETTADMSSLTFADMFSSVGKRTPLIARFSTVVHERQSPETLRDPRGFAIKFYTREGNWDLVGNNMPVFFIRNGIDFPDLVRAFKPNPQSHQQQWWRMLDFLSFHPECCHMLTFLLDDVGIPQNYRHMEGFGVHTFKLINKEGRETLVKFHWKPTCGLKSLMDDEAVVVGGSNHSHATKDLFDTIESGSFPEWRLHIQTMALDDQNKFEFDPLDVTKTWPEDRFPLREVGRMVLNRNVNDFFAENEQLAFSPANIVPGIGYSDDKLLQTRIFSYLDTQRHRLGNPYLLPVNAPRSQYYMQHVEGVGNVAQRHSDVNYFPSSHIKAREAPQYPIPSEQLSGKRERKNIEKENNFVQAGARWRSFDPARRERFVCRVADTLNSPRVTVELKRIWLHYWAQADKQLGAALAAKVRLTAAQ